MAEPWETEAADGRIVIEDYPQPEVRLDYFGGASGTYAGFDRFGRVIQQLWYDHGASEERDKFSYGFDRNSSRLYRKNEHTNGTNFSELYHANGAAANQAYDGWGNVSTSWQAHAGAADTSGGGQSPKVLYAYEDGQVSNEAKYVRLDSVTYPSGRVVYYNYPTTGTGVGRALARLDNMASSATPNDADKYVEYTTFLGAGTVVELEYPAVTVDNNPLVLTYGGSGTYAGFDRFGRITDQKWQIKTGTVKDRYTYDYDYNSNRLYRKNELSATHSELYHTNDAALVAAYDGLDRLKEFRRGTLSQTSRPNDTIADAGVTTKARQVFSLEALGNWKGFKDDAGPGDGGGGSWDLDHAREHNKVNEIADTSSNSDAIETTTGSDWIDPSHDMAGNMTTAPKPGAETTKLDLTYDAWNRLVRAEAIGSGLKVWWKLNEKSGTTAKDSSGNSKDGTLTDFPGEPGWTDGQFCGALDFDGTNDYVVCDDNWTATAYTISLWVKAGSPGQADGTGVFNNDADGTVGSAFEIDVDGETPGNYRWVGGSGESATIGQVSTTSWVHLAVTYDGTSIRVYYNGELTDTEPVGPGDAGLTFDDYVIGADLGLNDHFDGVIDDVRVYSSKLSDDEIADLAGISYAYDGANRRIVKLLPNAENWKRTDYYYNELWQCLEERYNGNVAGKTTVATAVRTQYVWGIRYIDAVVVRWHDLTGDEDFGDANEVLYYTNDANMNVTALVNTSGTVVERYEYSPYGKVTILDAGWSDDGDQISDVDNEILYCGYRYDPETGLYHVRNRPYHPTLGRMTVRDLERYLEGMSLYEYCISSPVGRVDWLGLDSAATTQPAATQPTASQPATTTQIEKKYSSCNAIVTVYITVEGLINVDVAPQPIGIDRPTRREQYQVTEGVWPWKKTVTKTRVVDVPHTKIWRKGQVSINGEKPGEVKKKIEIQWREGKGTTTLRISAQIELFGDTKCQRVAGTVQLKNAVINTGKTLLSKADRGTFSGKYRVSAGNPDAKEKTCEQTNTGKIKEKILHVTFESDVEVHVEGFEKR